MALFTLFEFMLIASSRSESPLGTTCFGAPSLTKRLHFKTVLFIAHF